MPKSGSSWWSRPMRATLSPAGPCSTARISLRDAPCRCRRWRSRIIWPWFQGQTARPFDRVTLNLDEGFAPQVGQELQVFRVSREVAGLGWVMRPTGSVTVVNKQDGATIAEVNRNVAPMTLGDLVRPVPRYPLRPGDMAEDVELGSMVATVIGWGEPHQLPQYGDIAFLDMGSRDGVSVGDEFVVATRTEDGFYDDLAGRLQVVSTGEEFSSARIIQMDGAVFSLGIEVFLDKKMR
jgi:hypothetical protein